MAAIIWADVVAFAPAAANTDPAAQTDILAHVNGALCVDEFGGESSADLKLARIYLAGHHSVASQFGAFAGPITAESVGGLSRSYANIMASGSSALYQTTIYGKMYLALIRAVVKTRMLVI